VQYIILNINKLGNIFRKNEMAIYEVIFPAIARVEADNFDEAKQKGADRAGFNYFTTYGKKDVISIKITKKYKICPICKFYIIEVERNICYYCK